MDLIEPPCPGEGYAGVARKGRFYPAFINYALRGLTYLLLPAGVSHIMRAYLRKDSAISETERFNFYTNTGYSSVVFHSRCMLSAGTASASLPRRGVCRRCPQRAI